MKKTFIAPVAEIIATETQEIIAASVGVNYTPISGSEETPIEAGARTFRTSTASGTAAISLEVLDF